jgi:3-dehydroquinate synthase
MPRPSCRAAALVARAGLPVQAPALGRCERWFELMRVDKKAEGGEIRFVLIDAPRPRRAAAPAPDALVREVLRATAPA